MGARPLSTMIGGRDRVIHPDMGERYVTMSLFAPEGPR
jgi:hypothetical protein